MNRLPPVAARKGSWGIFLFAQSIYYQRALLITTIFHVFLTLREAPPRLYHQSDQVLEAQDYWAHWQSVTADAIVLLVYNLHCAITLRLEGTNALRRSPRLQLFGVVLLLNVDLVINVCTKGTRPFRCLRPLVFVFSSVHQTVMLNSCA
jgi:hypothetical protein